jgi:transcriptional regulator with XRE-family HTH domain
MVGRIIMGFFLTRGPPRDYIRCQLMSIRYEGVRRMPNAENPPKRDMKRKNFGNLIRTARQARNLSQAALARAAKTSPVFVCQIEGGERLPSDRVARRLAMALGLHWQELVRIVYRLRSPEAGELFENPAAMHVTSIYEIPAVRSLLLHLAGLNLSERDIEALVRNWNNDVTLLLSVAESRRR